VISFTSANCNSVVERCREFLRKNGAGVPKSMMDRAFQWDSVWQVMNNGSQANGLCWPFRFGFLLRLESC